MLRHIHCQSILDIDSRYNETGESEIDEAFLRPQPNISRQIEPSLMKDQHQVSLITAPPPIFEILTSGLIHLLAFLLWANP